MGFKRIYPLVNVYIAMENRHCPMGKSSISTGPFEKMSQTVNVIARGQK